MTYFGFITIENENWLQGLVVLVAALIVLRVAVWLIAKYDVPDEESSFAAHRLCKFCGGRIVEECGEWFHVGDAHLVIRGGEHAPEPTSEVTR